MKSIFSAEVDSVNQWANESSHMGLVWRYIINIGYLQTASHLFFYINSYKYSSIAL